MEDGVRFWPKWFSAVSQDQSPGTLAAGGDFGFKVFTASNLAEKTKKLSAEQGRTPLCDFAVCFEFLKFVSRQPCFQHTACLLSSAGIRCAETCTDMIDICTCESFVVLIKSVSHIALQIAPYHIPSCDLISYHDMTLMILNEYTYIYIY